MPSIPNQYNLQPPAAEVVKALSLVALEMLIVEWPILSKYLSANIEHALIKVVFLLQFLLPWLQVLQLDQVYQIN